MGKVSELSMLVDELHKCGEILIGISEELADMFSSAAEEKPPVKKAAPKKKASDEPKPESQEEKPLTLEDVRAVCPEVLRHRVGLSYEAEAENVTPEDIINQVINAVVVP